MGTRVGMVDSWCGEVEATSSGFDKFGMIHWRGLLFPSSGDLPDTGIEPRSPGLQADSLLSEPPGKPF